MNVRAILTTMGGILAAIVVAVLGWGYWHVSTHADVHVSLRDVALKTERQLSGPLLAAAVLFRDETGTALASARADKPLGLVSIVHPTAGDCRREERAGGGGSGCAGRIQRQVVALVGAGAAHR